MFKISSCLNPVITWAFILEKKMLLVTLIWRLISANNVIHILIIKVPKENLMLKITFL